MIMKILLMIYDAIHLQLYIYIYLNIIDLFNNYLYTQFITYIYQHENHKKNFYYNDLNNLIIMDNVHFFLLLYLHDNYLQIFIFMNTIIFIVYFYELILMFFLVLFLILYILLILFFRILLVMIINMKKILFFIMYFTLFHL